MLLTNDKYWWRMLDYIIKLTQRNFNHLCFEPMLIVYSVISITLRHFVTDDASISMEIQAY